MADVLGSDTHVDPDAQATVTDFIDFTEYLPSDLERSLTLIEKLDNSYLDSTEKLHDLLVEYGDLPHSSDKRVSAQEAQALRAKISYDLDLTLNYREASFAEAGRLCDEVERHYNRLTSIKSKLLALPKPPSRDPTPQPLQQQLQATRSSAKDASASSPPHIKLRINNNRISSHSTRNQPTVQRSRKRRIIVPGEVLPPPNPDSPTPSVSSVFSSPSPPPPTPRREPRPYHRTIKPGPGRPGRPKVLKPHKQHKPPRVRKERPPRPPGQMGTNVHSAVAGISTSNALMLLTPPPADATPGSEHAPWMRLTEYEMARLRKRMKKNAIWAPSDTMIRRELYEAGRGPDNYLRAKAQAEEDGTELVDCDDLVNKDKNRDLLPGEINLDVKSKLFNKGMSLNVQKKEKKAALQREQAMQAKLEAEQAARNLGALGTSFKTLFERPSEGNGPYSPYSTFSQDRDRSVVKPQKKRKRDQVSPTEAKLHAQLHSEMAVAPASAKKLPKKKKPTVTPLAAPPNGMAATTTMTTTTTVPLAAAAASQVNVSTLASQPTSPNGLRKTKPAHVSLNVKDSVPDGPKTADSTTSRPPSRASSRRASAGGGGPSEPFSREHLRRKSVTPAPQQQLLTTLASRRSKRPAPGSIINKQEGGNISVGTRKNAPRKKGAAAAAASSNAQRKAADGKKGGDDAVEEDIDPDEPRYCICGDVSFGTMVMCENESVCLPSLRLLRACSFFPCFGFPCLCLCRAKRQS